MATKTNSSASRAWIASRVAALAKVPGTHKHPTMPGFQLRVSPKGLAAYAWRLRDYTGEQKSDTLGEAAEAGGTLSLADAVEEFERIKRRLQNPGSNITLGDAFEDWHKRELKGGGKKSPRTLVSYREVYSKRLAPEGADLPMSGTPVTTWHAILSKAKAGSASEGRIAYWILSATYRRCVELDIVPKNPVDSETFRTDFAGKSSRGVRETYLDANDLPIFCKGLLEVPRRGHGRAAAWVLYLTGWRLNCVLQMRWSQIDFKRNVYTVEPGEEGWKGYVGEMVLSTYAMSYLVQRQGAGGEAESKYVFPGTTTSKTPHIRSIYGTFKSASKCLGWLVKPHDCRRTFVTHGNTVLDHNLRLIGRLVGHVQKAPVGEDGSAMTNKYNQRQLVVERAAAELMGEALMGLGGMLEMGPKLREKFVAAGVLPGASDAHAVVPVRPEMSQVDYDAFEAMMAED